MSTGEQPDRVIDTTPFAFPPTFAAAFLGCRASAAWTIEAARGLRARPEPVDGPHADLIIATGEAHEAACVAALGREHGEVVAIPTYDPARRVQV